MIYDPGDVMKNLEDETDQWGYRRVSYVNHDGCLIEITVSKEGHTYYSSSEYRGY